MNNTTQQPTQFINLFTALCAEIKEQSANSRTEIMKTDNLDSWRVRDLLPKGKSISDFTSIAEAKAYLLKRIDKKEAKRIATELAHLQTIEAAPEFTGISISMEWKRSQMWGSNPKAEGRDGHGYYLSGSISGCGYDKGSTAVANVLNQSNALLKALYAAKEANVNIKNHELLGYGSGYGILPRFEGGVGVSCYPAIFNKIGFDFKTVASGKTFDAYTVDRLPVQVTA